jgi:hypothetical protein
VDLGLHNDHVVAKVGDSGFNFAGISGGVTARDGDSVFLKKAFGLILVDIHLFLIWCFGHESEWYAIDSCAVQSLFGRAFRKTVYS